MTLDDERKRVRYSKPTRYVPAGRPRPRSAGSHVTMPEDEQERPITGAEVLLLAVAGVFIIAGVAWLLDALAYIQGPNPSPSPSVVAGFLLLPLGVRKLLCDLGGHLSPVAGDDGILSCPRCDRILGVDRERLDEWAARALALDNLPPRGAGDDVEAFRG